MSDYIKREDINKLLNDLSFVTKTVIYNRPTGHTLEDILEHDFSELPSADVVEVVRCKDCIHNVGIRDNTEFYDKDIVCDYWESDGLYSTDYCSYGEKM